MLVRFLRNTRGGVAPLLALAAVPLMTAVGMAVDYSRANNAKAKFQAAMDFTALMLAKTAATKSAGDIQTSAASAMNSTFKYAGAEGLTVNAQYTASGGSKVTMTGSVGIPTVFMSLIGYRTVTISGASTAVWGDRRLRLALVLDNTGSMADSGKMTALKSATHSLLSQLQKAATTEEDVYISIVPFSKDVNMGSGNSAADWLRWDLWEAENGSCSRSKYTTASKCTSNGYKWTPADHSTWNGCVTDRDQNFDTTNDAPLSGANLYPAEQYSSCPAETMALTNDWTALSNKVDAMQPNGNTNQAIGLQVGWQSLTASPFTVPEFESGYKYTQAIILLTDGLNTEDRWYGNQSSIDAREKKTCDNIKAAGITIYTVQVNTGGDPTSTLLQNCASDPGKFFLLTSADQMVSTFNQIGTSLSQLHLSM